MNNNIDLTSANVIKHEMAKYKWYHTIDLGHGIMTPGDYDHRPYLPYYGLPENLEGKRVLDIGAASGFFSFEMERRGAEVIATDLPAWYDHDFSPTYQLDTNLAAAENYLREPFDFAKEVLQSKVKRHLANIYDLSAADLGTFDLVFCGSVLLHLTDPVKALWKIKELTKGVAIITTGIWPSQLSEPLAYYHGNGKGYTWWLPNRIGLEHMIDSTDFAGWRWFSDFRLAWLDGRPGTHHGVIHAWNDPTLVSLPDPPPPSMAAVPQTSVDKRIAELENRIKAYEQGRFIRLMAAGKRLLKKIGL